MISVCIPTYNGEKYISQQIKSIIKQLSEEDEIIISDDSSTDSTLEIIKGFNDSRITIYEKQTFHSPIYNLENALNKAKGDFIFLADQDDIWMDNKINVCIENLIENDLVISDAKIINGDEKVICDSFFKLNKTKAGKFYNLLKNGYLGCCMAFKKSVLEKSLPFPKKLPMHDIWIGNVAAFKLGRVKFITDKLILYRRHDNNVSITSEKSRRSFIDRVKDRLIIIHNLLRVKKI